MGVAIGNMIEPFVNREFHMGNEATPGMKGSKCSKYASVEVIAGGGGKVADP